MKYSKPIILATVLSMFVSSQLWAQQAPQPAKEVKTRQAQTHKDPLPPKAPVKGAPQKLDQPSEKDKKDVLKAKTEMNDLLDHVEMKLEETGIVVDSKPFQKTRGFINSDLFTKESVKDVRKQIIERLLEFDTRDQPQDANLKDVQLQVIERLLEFDTRDQPQDANLKDVKLQVIERLLEFDTRDQPQDANLKDVQLQVIEKLLEFDTRDQPQDANLNPNKNRQKK